MPRKRGSGQDGSCTTVLPFAPTAFSLSTTGPRTLTHSTHKAAVRTLAVCQSRRPADRRCVLSGENSFRHSRNLAREPQALLPK
jgi:hypothetical protein